MQHEYPVLLLEQNCEQFEVVMNTVWVDSVIISSTPCIFGYANTLHHAVTVYAYIFKNGIHMN